MQQEAFDEDDGIFGNRNARCKFIRLAYLIIIAGSLIVPLGAAIGTFSELCREFAEDNWIICLCITSVTAVVALVLYVILAFSSLRTYSPLNIILFLIMMICVTPLFFFAACNLNQGEILGAALAPELFFVFVILFSFFLDVSKLLIYIIGFATIMTPLIGIFFYLYFVGKVHLIALISAPFISAVFITGSILNTTWTMKYSGDDLYEEDYVQEAIYVVVGKMPLLCSRCNCCCCE